MDVGDGVLPHFGGKVEVGVEIVDDLSEDPGPVDRVDSSQSVGRVEIDIREEGLDRVL